MGSFFEIIKRAGWVAVQSLLLALLVCGHAWLIYTNFTALKVSFELLLYDGTPVGEDLLTGPIWESLGLYELTQAHMFAAAIAFFVGFLSAVAFHNAYLTVRLLMERKEYSRIGDTASVEQSNMAIVRHIALLCMILLPLIPVAYWDMQLFRLRSVAPVLGMENNAVAIKDWPLLLQQHSQLFAVSLARYGGWAYIFLVAGASLSVELWINYLREALARLGTSVRVWSEYINGGSYNNASAGDQNARQSDRAHTATSPVNSFTADAEKQKKTYVNNPENTNETVEWPEKPTVEPIYMASTGDNQNTDEEVTVYGGRPGERIKLSAAAADPENYYIDEMRRVWRRIFSSGVHDEEQAEAA